jgi:hypothetical protein
MKALALNLVFTLSLLPAVALAEEDIRIGRLFMEPSTRQQLDESRKQNSSAQQLPATEDNNEAAVTSLKMDGVVMRRDGSTEVWVNGVRSGSQLAVRRTSGDRFQVSVPGGGEITLKPGQIYSFEMRRVIEGYEAEKELVTEGKTAESKTAAEPEAAAPQPAGQAAPPQGEVAKPQQEEFDESKLAKQDFRIKLEQEKSGK